MQNDEIKVENIEEREMIDCIKIFDEELKIFLSKAPESQDIILDKYVRKAIGNGDLSIEIQMNVTKEGQSTTVSFNETFFDDYCYCDRKERDTLLRDTLNKIKNKLK